MSDRYSRRAWPLVVAGFALTVLLLAGAVPTAGASSPRAVEGPEPTAVLNLSGPVGNLTPNYWSVDAQVTNPNAFRVDPNVGSYLNASGFDGIGYVRYGAGADECNETTNSFYNASGLVISGCPNNITAIKDWCSSLAVACRTVLDLPGENNNSGEDAAIVRNIVDVKRFQPTYFAIGNEPESWTHYGEPWVDWRPTDHSTPTAMDYAWDVHDAIAAIRGVDPSAQFVGIEADGSFDVAFPQAVLALNAPNISVMAVHIYPHPSGTSGGVEPLALYLDGLSVSTGALPNPAAAYARFAETVHTACASCGRIQVEVGEFNSGPTQGAPPNENMEFAGAVYLAGGEAQFLDEGAPIVEVFKLQGAGSPCSDCLMNFSAGDALDPEGQFLESFPPLLGGGTVWNTTVVSSLTNLWAATVKTANASGLLFVNANVTASSVTVGLPASLFPVNRTVTIREWTSGGAISTSTVAAPATLDVPSLSIVVVHLDPLGQAPENSSGVTGPSPTLGFGVPHAFGAAQAVAVGAFAVGGVLLAFWSRRPLPDSLGGLPRVLPGTVFVAIGLVALFLV